MSWGEEQAARFLRGSEYLITRSNQTEASKHLAGIYLENSISQWWPVLRLVRSFPTLQVYGLLDFQEPASDTYTSAVGRGQSTRLENQPEVWYSAVHTAGTTQAFGSGGDTA